MKPLLFSILLVFLFTAVAQSQNNFGDKLVKRDGKTIMCKIIEIGDDEIKYNEEGLRTDIIVGIDKSKVAMIVFSDGKELKIDNGMAVYEDFSAQNKNALKFNLFSPIFGGYSVAFERSLKPARSIETEIGLIAKGKNNEMGMPEAHGMFLKAGYKMMRSPDFYLRGMKYAHLLKGSYVKPEITFTAFKYTKDNEHSYNNNPESGTTARVAIMVNVGKQYIFSNAFAIDFFVGAGYAAGKIDSDLNYYAFRGFSSDVSFVMTSGVRVGFLFGK